MAAPILPGTAVAAQAELLTRLAAANDADLKARLRDHRGVDPQLDAAIGLEAAHLRRLVETKLREGNVISGGYKHVDGTSFASPIVCSIAAQMIEANPRLLPRQVKRLLIDTARRIPHVPIDRQGWGVADAGAAVRAALESRLKPGKGRGGETK